MSQKSFSDLEYATKKKRTRREGLIRLFGGPDPEPAMASKEQFQQRFARKFSFLELECIALK